MGGTTTLISTRMKIVERVWHASKPTEIVKLVAKGKFYVCCPKNKPRAFEVHLL